MAMEEGMDIIPLEIVGEEEDCHECNESDFTIESMMEWPPEKIQAAILAELVMIRGLLQQGIEGMAAIGSLGSNGILGMMFGKKD